MTTLELIIETSALFLCISPLLLFQLRIEVSKQRSSLALQRVALKGPSDEYESENVGVMLCDTVKDFEEIKKLIDAVPLGVGFIEKNRLLTPAN